jgi:hypothetical protein
MQNKPPFAGLHDPASTPSVFSGKGVPLSSPESPKNNMGLPKREIVLVTSDLQFPPKYLHCPKTGQYDLLGQILYSLGYAVPPKTRLPSQLNLPIPYFTVTIRDHVVDSALSQSILIASRVVHPREIVAHANVFLAHTPFVLVKG